MRSFLFHLISLCHLFISINALGSCKLNVTQRAYVTAVDGTPHNLLRIKVLKKSLELVHTTEDVIALIPEHIVTSELLKTLKKEDIKTHIISTTSLRKVKMPNLLEMLPLWSFELVNYKRVIYLDPFTLVLSNLESMFHCEGYCGSVESKFGPVVLEPSLDTFTYLFKQLKYQKHDFLQELQWFYNLKNCPTFLGTEAEYEELADDSELPKCQKFHKSTLATCHQLPLHMGVPSSKFTSTQIFSDLICSDCEFRSALLIVYPRDGLRWEATFFTDKAIMWRWYYVRSLIETPIKLRVYASFSFFFAMAMIIISLLCLRAAYFQKVNEASDDVIQRVSSSLNQICSAPKLRTIFRLIVTIVLASACYHFSLRVGRKADSFAWEPLMDTVVSFGWNTLTLLTGLMAIDYIYILQHTKSFVILSEMIAVALVFLLVNEVELFSERDLLERIVVILNIMICIKILVYRQASSGTIRPETMRLKLSKEDIVTFLQISMVYCCYLIVCNSINVPEAFRVLLLRLAALIHSLIIILIIVMIEFRFHVRDVVSFSSYYLYTQGTKAYQLLTSVMPTSDQMKTFLKTYWHLVVTFLMIYLVLYAREHTKYFKDGPKMYPYFCLQQEGHYLNPIHGFSKMCGSEEAFVSVPSKEFSETFLQTLKCFQTLIPKSNNRYAYRYLTMHRDTKSECDPTRDGFAAITNQYHYGHREGFCMYNPMTGQFLSTHHEPQEYCSPTEKWKIILTHYYTNYWSIASKLLYFMRYECAVKLPQLVIVVATFFVGLLFKIPTSQSKVRAIFVTLLFMLIIYLLHVIIVYVFWGHPSYISLVENHSSKLSYYFETIGVLHGPRFLSLVSIFPERCPETVWLQSNVLYTFGPILFFVLFGFGFFDISSVKVRKDVRHLHVNIESVEDGPKEIVQPSPTSSTTPTMRKSASSARLKTNDAASSAGFVPHVSCIEESSNGNSHQTDHENENRTQLNLNSRMKKCVTSRIVSFFVCALFLTAIFSLIFPFQLLAYNAKLSCRGYEERFDITGFSHSHVNFVLIFANALIMCCYPYLRQCPIHWIGIIYTLCVYAYVWLTTDYSYVSFALHVAISYVSWEFLSLLVIYPFYRLIHRGEDESNGANQMDDAL